MNLKIARLQLKVSRFENRSIAHAQASSRQKGLAQLSPGLRRKWWPHYQ
jgi:hypothetical protein